jgi:protein-L-isoaspartate(D-aspartate) O-methyltransferase
MRCHEIMSAPVETTSEAETVTEVARRMRDRHLGFMPVCDAGGRAIGVITDRDIAIRACAGEMSAAPVKAVMTPRVVSCQASDSVQHAEALMREHRTSRVVVVEADGRTVGVISVADLALLEDPEAAATLRRVAVRDAREPADAEGADARLVWLRRRMVERLVDCGITDRAALRALISVPRELFVPPELADRAYDDRELPLGGGRTVPAPFAVAQMAAALHPHAGERLLHVGAGTGYATAIFACLAGVVTAVERDAVLAEAAAQRLRALGVSNVRVVHADTASGTYDAIAVAAPDAVIPTALLAQLAIGGRLVTVAGPELVRVTRTGPDLYRRDVLPATGDRGDTD